MSECKVCKTTENIVYSGVDALLLGIPNAETETTCYPCANKARIPASTEIEVKDFLWSELDHFRICLEGALTNFKHANTTIDFTDIDLIVMHLKAETLKLEKKVAGLANGTL